MNGEGQRNEGEWRERPADRELPGNTAGARPPEERKPRNLAPVILIVAGILLLMGNFVDFLFIDVWGFLANFWPFLLIAVGVDLLLRGRHRRSVIIATLIAAVAVWAFGDVRTASGGSPQPVSATLDGARDARVTISTGIARLDLEGGLSTDELIAGSVLADSAARIDQDVRRSGSTIEYTLRSDSRTFVFPFGGRPEPRDWDLRLTDRIPVDLHLNTGVGDARLDLSRVQLSALEVDTGVGDADITLPASGDYRARIDGGVGDVTLRIPRQAAARIQVDSGLGRVNVSGNYEVRGDTYVSPDFSSASNRVDVFIDGGVGSISVHSY